MNQSESENSIQQYGQDKVYIYKTGLFQWKSFVCSNKWCMSYTRSSKWIFMVSISVFILCIIFFFSRRVVEWRIAFTILEISATIFSVVKRCDAVIEGGTRMNATLSHNKNNK